MVLYSIRRFAIWSAKLSIIPLGRGTGEEGAAEASVLSSASTFAASF